jgi:hypothetical protein
MHAIVLMAHFHTLSSLVHGCGLMPEVCHIDGHYYGSSLTNGFALTGKPNLEEVLSYDGILIVSIALKLKCTFHFLFNVGDRKLIP